MEVGEESQRRKGCRVVGMLQCTDTDRGEAQRETEWNRVAGTVPVEEASQKAAGIRCMENAGDRFNSASGVFQD